MILKLLLSSYLILTQFTVMILQGDITRMLFALINDDFLRTDVCISQEYRLKENSKGLV